MQTWYNLPSYYDVSFSHDMGDELQFLKDAFKKYLKQENAQLLEPVCGTGRLLVPLLRSGFQCTGFDINTNALRYLRQRLVRNKLSANLFQADMTSFSIQQQFDGAYCTVDTFRHLLTENDAIQHLIHVGRRLKRNGIYIIGLHLLPKHGITDRVSRWQAKRGRLTVNTTMTMLEHNKKQRTETLQVVLKTSNHDRHESSYKLRTYSANQFITTVKKAGLFKMEQVHDHYYDLNKIVNLDSSSDYGVFILRKV